MPSLHSIAAVLAAALAVSPALAVPLTVTALDEAGAPLANAAVAVYVKGAAARASAGTGVVEMSQRGRRFVPPVVVVQTGTPVNFPNLDTVRHHVYSFSPAKTFEIKLYAGTPAAPVVFDKPGTAVLGCNIHDRMVGYVHVVDTPYFALTDETGTARLDVPAGDHQLQLWHASLARDQPLPGMASSVRGDAGRASFRLPGK